MKYFCRAGVYFSRFVFFFFFFLFFSFESPGGHIVCPTWHRPERLSFMAIIKHKSQRVGIFIDTQNLYHSAKNLYKAKVNFGQVVKEAVAGRQLIRAIAYVIRTESEEEKGFFDALNKLGIETKVKDIRVFAGGAKKADWDIGMAIDAIAMAEKLDTIILATGDGDFVPLV